MLRLKYNIPETCERRLTHFECGHWINWMKVATDEIYKSCIHNDIFSAYQTATATGAFYRTSTFTRSMQD